MAHAAIMPPRRRGHHVKQARRSSMIPKSLPSDFRSGGGTLFSDKTMVKQKI
jgi:hypothetical protein